MTFLLNLIKYNNMMIDLLNQIKFSYHMMIFLLNQIRFSNHLMKKKSIQLKIK